MEQTTHSNIVAIIKNLYLYIVSFVALMMIVFPVADLINTGLKYSLFPKADSYYYGGSYDCVNGPGAPAPTAEDCAKREETRKKQEEYGKVAHLHNSLARDIAYLIVGLPVFAFHWKLLRRKEGTL
jgi:hypothetical protein